MFRGLVPLQEFVLQNLAKLVKTGRVMKIPTGTFVKSSDGTYFIGINRSNQSVRYRVKYRSVLDSWQPPRIVNVSDALLKDYPIVGSLPYRDGTLLYNASTGIIYLMSASKKCRVRGGELTRLLGLHVKDVMMVSDQELEYIGEGSDIN
jgi:hypothetical protein